MEGVGTPIIGRPRPLPGHNTPNPARHPHTLNYEEPYYSNCFSAVVPVTGPPANPRGGRLQSLPVLFPEIGAFRSDPLESLTRITRFTAPIELHVWYRIDCESETLNHPLP